MGHPDPLPQTLLKFCLTCLGQHIEGDGQGHLKCLSRIPPQALGGLLNGYAFGVVLENTS